MVHQFSKPSFFKFSSHAPFHPCKVIIFWLNLLSRGLPASIFAGCIATVSKPFHQFIFPVYHGICSWPRVKFRSYPWVMNGHGTWISLYCLVKICCRFTFLIIMLRAGLNTIKCLYICNFNDLLEDMFYSFYNFPNNIKPFIQLFSNFLPFCWVCDFVRPSTRHVKHFWFENREARPSFWKNCCISLFMTAVRQSGLRLCHLPLHRPILVYYHMESSHIYLLQRVFQLPWILIATEPGAS